MSKAELEAEIARLRVQAESARCLIERYLTRHSSVLLRTALQELDDVFLPVEQREEAA